MRLSLNRRRVRRILKLWGATVVVGLGVGAACDRWVGSAAAGRIVHDPSDAPARDVALVLGTAPTSNGRPNLFFAARMDAAARLYASGKVRHLLVSGDNHRADYDEPSAMRDALVARGVPESAITLDYAGFRTLDSVVRAREVFGQTRLLIVSQEFHCARALFIARSRGIDAFALAAPSPGGTGALVVRAREVLARTAAVLDTKVLRTAPHFPGPAEPMVLRAHPAAPGANPPGGA